MNYKVVVALTFVVLAACQKHIAHDEIQKEHSGIETSSSGSTPNKFILPVTVVPKSDSLPYFGIVVSKLSSQEAEVVVSSWNNYQKVLAGKIPDCPPEFGLSDGGSMMYDCGSYKLMRVKSIPEQIDKRGFDYGPSLDFLNGHKVEKIRFVSYQELNRLESAP